MVEVTSDSEPREYSIDMNDVSIAYGSKKVIHQISFKVEKGSILGLIGGSGAGK